MMEVVVATGAVKRAKLQSDVTTDIRAPNFLQTGCPSSHPTNSVGELKEEHLITSGNT